VKLIPFSGFGSFAELIVDNDQYKASCKVEITRDSLINLVATRTIRSGEQITCAIDSQYMFLVDSSESRSKAIDNMPEILKQFTQIVKERASSIETRSRTSATCTTSRRQRKH